MFTASTFAEAIPAKCKNDLRAGRVSPAHSTFYLSCKNSEGKLRTKFRRFPCKPRPDFNLVIYNSHILTTNG